uniref:Uncharacterized protein n=1 Tax=Kalanchoe fedtschenkoi TaxID=63787 RepID=A0A7N0TNU4_KALFE
MGNIIASFFSGLGNAISTLFNTPLDFLSGKSCNSACGATWDFICYLENFCVTHLLKMAMVIVLCYMVLLFLYLLYKMGICGCVARSLCRFYWACIRSCFSACDYCCRFIWVKTLKSNRRRKRRKRRRRRRVRDIENNISSSEYEEDESSVANTTSSTDTELESRSVQRRRRGGSRRADRLRNSLRPRSHDIGVNVGRSLSHRRRSATHGNSNRADILQDEFHDVRISRSYKFARKGRTHMKHKRRDRSAMR